MEENFIIDKKAKRILYIFMIIIMGTAIALVCWNILKSPSRNQFILNNASAMSFHGNVDSIYFDRQNHNTETLVLSDGYLYGIDPAWSTFIAVGDSLAKDTGTVRVLVYKDGKQVHVLDYKELIKHFKSKN